MTDDLHGRLLVAIAAKEQRAKDATDGPWEIGGGVGRGGWSIVGDVTAADKPEVAGHGHDGGGVWFWQDADLIADNGPDDILLACSAHREIVERHSGRTKSVLRNGESIDHCAYCQQSIPCPDLRSMARGYGLRESA